MSITNDREMPLQGQQEEMEGEPYTVKILSPKYLDLFVEAVAELKEFLRQKIHQFERTTRQVARDPIEVSSEFEGNVDRIKTILLPSIPEKLHRLCDTLSDSIYLQKLEAPRLRNGMKVLDEIESTVNQICSLMTSFWVPDRHQFFPYDQSDGHTERFERYKCERVQSKLADAFTNLHEFLQCYHDLLPLPERRTMQTRQLAKSDFEYLINSIRLTEGCGKHLIEWCDMSELGAIREHWQHIARELEDLLGELVEFLTINKDIHAPQPLREFILILKLSRLFFNKISIATSEEFYPTSDMNTAQLLNLIDLTVSIPYKLMNAYDEMECYNAPRRNINLQKVSDLAKLFQAPLNLLSNHLSDQAANPNSPENVHVKFIQWYADWQSHFSLAIRRFHIAYRDTYSNFLIAN
ncbi:hypothetical protein PGT21_016263 [Puccinia graminis f. sp. tritici]|uniref:Uncharacterized protein n=1 Tax=Puccinia graminis f. sp. tritici TaxID=56615 RepID=A0A5B0LKQ0_PUCGR|nr:hypothetical protein PGT21_016263 [Puccinia graminis f. sp. tritici]